MRPLLQDGAAALAELARGKVLLAFDFDGTLAPIVDEPHEARMSERTRGLLERLCRHYPCIVVSGRAQADVLKRVRGLGVLEAIGNHGLEPWANGDEYARKVQSWGRVLSDALASASGITIEDKVYSLAIHYRAAPDEQAATSAILAAASRLEPLRIIPGHQVINLIPSGAPNKGIALQAAQARLGCETALYVGDDETDEDVFALQAPGRLVGVRVGRSQHSLAGFFLEDQAEIDALLERLLSLRP